MSPMITMFYICQPVKMSSMWSALVNVVLHRDGSTLIFVINHDGPCGWTQYCWNIWLTSPPLRSLNVITSADWQCFGCAKDLLPTCCLITPYHIVKNSSAGARSSNELPWSNLNIGHRDNSPRYCSQGEIVYSKWKCLMYLHRRVSFLMP